MELRTRALGYLNIDSPGSRGATIWDCRYNCGEIEAVTDAVVRELSGQAANIRRPLKAGDQSFLGVGLPSIGAFRMLPVDHPDRKAVGGCGGGWWWHTPHDTLDKADEEILAEDTRLYATLVARMCTPKLHPYHFGPVAGDFIDAIASWQDKGAGHLDLSQAMDRAIEFQDAALALAALALETDDEAGIERLNRGHLKLSRLLNPTLFTIAGPYEFDPALQMPVLPGLAGSAELPTLDPASDHYGFLKTQLVRQRNRIADTLAEATALAHDLVRA
jgi:hypothetical protein